jgi:hypothetical protein
VPVQGLVRVTKGEIVGCCIRCTGIALNRGESLQLCIIIIVQLVLLSYLLQQELERYAGYRDAKYKGGGGCD